MRTSLRSRERSLPPRACTAGIKARNEALLRAQPVEPINQKRAETVKLFGTLLYNPIYDTQQVVDGPPLSGD